MTCPDITFAVSTLSQYLESPTTTHLIAVKRVIRYLKGTKHLCLTLGGHEIDLSGYSDADWASQLHHHSISGFTFFLGSSAISWSSKKQHQEKGIRLARLAPDPARQARQPEMV